MWNINAPLNVRFSYNLQSLYPVSGALAVKISLDLLKGLRSYGGCKLMVSGFCQIFSITRSATRRYLIYSGADFEGFCPAGATRCTDGGEIRNGGGDQRSPPLLHATFYPHWWLVQRL